jgi:hypothetical protein
MFMSPRSDLTIRNLTAEQIEAICNAAVDIVGGVVSFSESAIYESEDTTKKEDPVEVQCPKGYRHPPHRWFDGPDLVVCQGVLLG